MLVAIPAPPDMLDEEAQKEWRRCAPELHRCGLLTMVDLNVLAAYCQAFSRWITAERAIATMARSDPLTGGLIIRTAKGTIVPNPLVTISLKATFAMLRYAAEFGMTPAARSRIALGAHADFSDPLSLLME